MAAFAKALLACAALCVFSAVSTNAQENEAVLRDNVFPTDYLGRDAQIQAREKARAAEIRRTWLESGHTVDSRAINPKILSGRILTSSVNVKQPPAAPAVRVKFRTGNPGLYGITLYFYSDSASGQYISVSYYVPYLVNGPTEGTIIIQRPNGYSYGNSGAFNLYNAAGTWTLAYGYIYDRQGNYTSYDATTLAGLFPSLTFALTNNASPDTVAPQITAGQILTSVIHKSTDPHTFIARLTVSDDVSGVGYYYVSFQSPDSAYFGSGNNTPSPELSGNVKAYTYLGDNPKRGVWVITQVAACDLAGNCTYISGDSNIMAVFGTTTFRVRR